MRAQNDPPAQVRACILSTAIADAAGMEALGAKIGQLCQPGDCLLLIGDLGAGKTTLTKGMVEGLGGDKSSVQSPTFALLHTYPLSRFPDSAIWHFDFYRLKQQQELWETGLDEALQNGITLIEWPQLAMPFIPAGSLIIEIGYEGGGRRVHIYGNDAWRQRCFNILPA